MSTSIFSESGFFNEEGNLFDGGSYTVFAPTDRAFNDYLLSFEGGGPDTMFNLGNGVRPGIERLKRNKDELVKVFFCQITYVSINYKVRLNIFDL